jgi:hypothetical protein
MIKHNHESGGLSCSLKPCPRVLAASSHNEFCSRLSRLRWTYIDALWPGARCDRRGMRQMEMIRQRRVLSHRPIVGVDGWNVAIGKQDACGQ